MCYLKTSMEVYKWPQLWFSTALILYFGQQASTTLAEYTDKCLAHEPFDAKPGDNSGLCHIIKL